MHHWTVTAPPAPLESGTFGTPDGAWAEAFHVAERHIRAQHTEPMMIDVDGREMRIILNVTPEGAADVQLNPRDLDGRRREVFG